MRVLCFTNILPKPVTHKLGLPEIFTGGWVENLRLALHKYSDLELGVATPSIFNYEPFEEDGTIFYNIHSLAQNGTWGSMYRRWLHTTNVSDGLKNCLEIINKFQPDIIHVNGSEDYFGLLAKETPIPVILSVQGILSIYNKFAFAGFSFQDILIDNFSKNGIRGISTIHRYLTMKNSATQEREIVKACKYFTGRTEFDKNFVSLLNPNSHYYHCDRILRPPFYSTDWCPPPSGGITVYCTTTPFPRKGLNCLLEACSILKVNGFPDLHLRISGQIQNSDIWGITKRKIKEYDLTDEVTWLGKSSADSISRELNRANVFVLPSYIENSPNSLGEAMLVGIPCVASYTGGVPSMITHGKDGLLFQPGDPFSLAAMIAKIIREPLLAKSLSENAKITARLRHDPEKIAITMVDIYSDIINHFPYKN
jgi:glycosyltransferase involved in cell wall biosynthesis